MMGRPADGPRQQAGDTVLKDGIGLETYRVPLALFLQERIDLG